MGKLALLAALYFLTGKLGLLLAVPPGYATIIWPPSGLALGALLTQGWRLWPGILIGSFFLNAYISGVWPADGLVSIHSLLAPAGIACGSTLQALFAYHLIKRFFGIPIQFKNGRQLVFLALLAGPGACCVAASVGVASLAATGIMPVSEVVKNWITWWSGDVLGILIFLPLVLFAPGHHGVLRFKERTFGAMPSLFIVLIITVLGMTFYAWKLASETVYQQNFANFKTMAVESEKALQLRMASYSNALLGGVGFIDGSNHVSRQEWHTYVQSLEIERNFPGLMGLGVIVPVHQDQKQAFQAEMRREGSPDYTIHPKEGYEWSYIVDYIEPVEPNKQSVGLDISFDQDRRGAADLAKETQLPAITNSITLVQDNGKTPGFLLLHSIDKKSTFEVDRNINVLPDLKQGWVYAPFRAREFFNELTENQGQMFNVRIYDVDHEDPQNLVYSSAHVNEVKPYKTAYTLSKTVEVMQKKWFIVWEATQDYELLNQNHSPLIILLGGLFLTGLLAAFLAAISLNQVESSYRHWSRNKILLIPLAVFGLSATGSFYLYKTLDQEYASYIDNIIQQETSSVQQSLEVRSKEYANAIMRMAQRWTIDNGTPFWEWQGDAKNYVHDIKGLRAVEWIDPSHKVSWVEPLNGNEAVIGRSVMYSAERKHGLDAAAVTNGPSFTHPLKLRQGYEAFIIYAPVFSHGVTDGFIGGLFSLKEFIEAALTRDILSRYSVGLISDGKILYQSALPEKSSLAFESDFDLLDQQFTLSITSLERHANIQKSIIPVAALILGLLISALLAITLRYIFISRFKAAALKNSEERYDLVVRGMSVGLWDWNVITGHMYWSPKLNEIFGIADSDFEPDLDYFADILHPDDKEATLAMLTAHLEQKGPYNIEYRIRQPDGQYLWAHASGQAIWDKQGKPVRMGGSVSDITVRKKAQQALNRANIELERSNKDLEEFAYVASHDLKAPLRVIDNASKWLEEDLAEHLNNDTRESMGLLRNRVRRMEQFLDDLLAYARIGRSNDPRFHEQVPGDRIVNDSVNLLDLPPGFLIEVNDNLKNISLPRMPIQQVLHNLISNAIRHHDLKSGHIWIDARQENGFNVFEVKDDGPGIPREFQEKAFKMFQTLKPRDQMEGSGMGLAIVLKNVEKAGGRIELHSEGRGCTFKIYLPVVNT